MRYIAEADDKKVKGLYMLIEDDMGGREKRKLADEYINMLEKEREKHLKGKRKSYG